ncbi:MAG: hypothetical protein H6Q86_5950 [candidate division NC10 bacterium]|nr:hypothetical protein [candidate division NC10 bacterium]
MRGAKVAKVVIGVWTAGSLALAAGLALAATTETKTPEAAKAPAVRFGACRSRQGFGREGGPGDQGGAKGGKGSGRKGKG